MKPSNASHLRLVRAVLIAGAAVLGCGRAAPPARTHGDSSAGVARATDSATSRASPAATPAAPAPVAADTASPWVAEHVCAPADSAHAGWACVEWNADGPGHARDLGIGVVIFRPSFDGYTVKRLQVDTLVFHAAPSREAAAVGLLVEDEGSSEAPWRYGVAAPKPLAPNLEAISRSEDGVEESGVPIDSVDASGTWVRGILGFDSAGAALTGWAELRDDTLGTVRHILWASYLPAYGGSLAFVQPRSARLYDTPGDRGKPGRAHPLPPQKDGYDISPATPAAMRGQWMRVRVVSPHAPCGESEATGRARTHFYWIRYLDDRGRPLVTNLLEGPEC